MAKFPEWENTSGVEIFDEEVRRGLMGFIYLTTTKDGRFYIGRKQFWKYSRGKQTGSTDWRDYFGSSSTLKVDSDQIERRTILAVFTTKSTLRFAEAAAIILSGSYYPDSRGLNWSFEGCRGTLKFTGRDREQLDGLLRRWR